jgi:hypothetical protein
VYRLIGAKLAYKNGGCLLLSTKLLLPPPLSLLIVQLLSNILSLSI